MCEFCEYVRQNREAMRGRSVYEMFPDQARVIPYESVTPRYCMLSDVPLKHEEMHPPGRCTRSLSQEQYGYIVNNRRSNCSMCGSPLSADKIQGQQYAPREVENHFCDNCIPYWSILHSKVVGEDMSFLADEQVDVVDRHAVNREYGRSPVNPPIIPELEHNPPESFEAWKVRTGGTHKDKPLVEIPLKKNDKDIWEY